MLSKTGILKYEFRTSFPNLGKFDPRMSRIVLGYTYRCQTCWPKLMISGRLPCMVSPTLLVKCIRRSIDFGKIQLSIICYKGWTWRMDILIWFFATSCSCIPSPFAFWFWGLFLVLLIGTAANGVAEMVIGINPFARPGWTMYQRLGGHVFSFSSGCVSILFGRFHPNEYAYVARQVLHRISNLNTQDGLCSCHHDIQCLFGTHQRGGLPMCRWCQSTVNAYTSMHIQNIASCIDFLKATCFRLDKAFSKASLRFLHSSLVSTKSLHSFVDMAGFEVESAQPLRCYSPKVEPLSSASVEFRIKNSCFTFPTGRKYNVKIHLWMILCASKKLEELDFPVFFLNS